MSLTLDYLLKKADAKLNNTNMNKTVVSIVKEVIKEMYEAGIYVGVSGAFRSFAEQDELYKQGRTKAGAIVTNAKGGQSNHNYGVAVDLFQYSEDGKEAIYENGTKRFNKIVSAMKSRGMKWGGDWNGSFKDYPHFELYDRAGGEKMPTKTDTKTVSKSSLHTIKKGETLSGIAEDYKTTVSNLKKWNGLDTDKIIAGDKLKVKAPAKKVEKKYYTVVVGDMAYRIAENHNLTLDQLKKLNPDVKDMDKIYPQQKLRVK